MKFKTGFMLALYFVPYAFMLTPLVETVWMFLLLWVIMGIGVAGIGLSIMHDANHGAYSKSPRVNKIVGYCLNLVGGSAANWKMQHNVLHHSFTNIDGMDEDIAPLGIMRFSPHQKRRKIHKAQYIYAWFFYALMNVSWIIQKDFTQLVRYDKMGLVKGQRSTLKKMMTELIISKSLFYTYVVVVPILVTDFAWYWVIAGLFIVLLVSGFILACIFQPAHVMPTSEYPLPDETGNIENDWAVHQLATTTNFAPKAKLFSWFVGGLNFQIEHHLFPNICHVHYKQLSKIVKKTADEFNLPYNVQPTFAHALIEHGRMLHTLGRKDLV